MSSKVWRLPPFLSRNISLGFSREETVEKVKTFFDNNKDSLVNMRYKIRSQGQNFVYYPVHLAVIFKRGDILDVIYTHMEDKQFASSVLSLAVTHEDSSKEKDFSSLSCEDRSL